MKSISAFVICMICSLSSIYSYSPLLTKKLHPHAALQLHNESSYLFRNSVCHTALLASKKDDVGSSLGGRSSEVESNSRGIFASLKSSPWFWKGAMMLICIIWSTNFAVIKQLFDALPPGVLDPSLYTAIRFTIAAVVMSPGAVGSLNKPGLVMNGILAGLCVFTGYFGQSIGLMHSTANKAAFFCSMNVVWVALVSGVMTKSFKKKTWLAVLLAVSGVGFLELRGTVVPSINDLWLLLQPLGFGTGYLVLERNMRDYPGSARAITSLKLITLSILTIIWALANGHSPQDVLPIFQNKVATLSILYTSLVTTAFAIYLQSIVFKKVTSTDASIILTTEPIWATLFSAVLIGEVTNAQEMVGGSLIILACLVNEMSFGQSSTAKTPPAAAAIGNMLYPWYGSHSSIDETDREAARTLSGLSALEPSPLLEDSERMA